MCFKLGITGFIGMGKTTVCSMFSKHKIPVWDADQNVHKIYEYNCAGYTTLTSKYPKLINSSGIDRNQLSKMIKQKEVNISDIEKLIHPLLKLERDKFIEQYSNHSILVFDIPLLYETNPEEWLNSVLKVSCSKKTQLNRLLKRKNMSREKINMLMSRQQKNRRRDKEPQFFINTDKTLSETKKDVENVIKTIKSRLDVKRSSP